MWMDAVTEKITHFIGAFELIEQEIRMRAEYDKFRTIKAAEDDASAIELRSLKTRESYKLEDAEAGVTIKAPPPQAEASAPELIYTVAPNEIYQVSAVPALVLQVTEVIGPLAIAASNAVQNFIIPPPSSIAQVTYQANALSDNDSFGAVSAGGFQAVLPLIESLQFVYAGVTSLLPMEMDVLPSSANWPMVLGKIQDAVAEIGIGTYGKLTTTVLLGSDAHGIVVDGVAADAFTSFKDMQPAYIAEKIAKAEAAAEPYDPTTDGHDFDADFGKGESPFKVEGGHAIVAGANSLVNTASITSTWLDAEMIVVAGDVVRMDAISQVNVIIDHDSVTNAMSAADLAPQGSMASNAAAIAVQTVASAKLAAQKAAAEASGEQNADDDAEPAAEADLPILTNAPANWAVVRYDGPVTQINWVKQYTFTTDYDQAVVTLSGGSTFLGMGENNLTNSFNIKEFGFHYDLILVGGNLIDIKLVSQLNVLLDSDVIDSVLPGTIAQTEANVTALQNESQSAVATGSTDTVAQAAVTPSTSINGAGVDGTSQQATAISGAPTDEAIVEDVGDHPTLETTAASDDTLANSPAPATDSAFSTGDNLTYNQASIETIGEDVDAAITQTFSDVLDSFAQGNDHIPDEVVQDSAFLGTELLRVLYIDGDFMSANMVDQVNVLGDADQVHLTRDNFAAALQEQIKVTTGSNVLANVAAIKDNGMDSTVMSQGGTYSDALIYQANLIDADVMDTGTSIADLANEAVAFLTDDMADDMGHDITTMTNALIADTMDQSDLMQTMLS